MKELRLLRYEDTDDSAKLSSFAFQYDLSPEQKAGSRAGYDPDQTLGIFVDGQLAAKVHLIAFEMYVEGKVYSMCGVGGVATWPEYRRQGFVAELLKHSIQVMKERGHVVSVLHPFSFEFYRKFGWEWNTQYKKYEVDKGLLQRFANVPGHMKRLSDVEDSWAVCGEVYDAFAANYNGMLKRTANWWKGARNHRIKGHVSVYYNELNQATGYIIYEVKSMELAVKELVYLDDEARRGLWTFIAQHDSMISKVTANVPVDDYLPALLGNPRIKQELVPFSMARIVDLEALLKDYAFAATGRETMLHLAVTDDQAEWNQGVFSLRISPEGQAEVSKLYSVLGEQESGSHTLSCGIQALSGLLMGGMSPEMLAGAGRLTGDQASIDLLSSVLRDRKPVSLYDFF